MKGSLGVEHNKQTEVECESSASRAAQISPKVTHTGINECDCRPAEARSRPYTDTTQNMDK